jgi:hypothetical protein
MEDVSLKAYQLQLPIRPFIQKLTILIWQQGEKILSGAGIAGQRKQRILTAHTPTALSAGRTARKHKHHTQYLHVMT